MTDDRDADDTPDDGEHSTRIPPADRDTDERPTTASDSEDVDTDDAPLSGLRANIEERRKRRQRGESSTPDVDEVFEQASSEPVIDGDQVWEDLVSGQGEAAGVLAFGEPVEGESEDVTVIPNSVCHSCTYFGEPPELHCTHEGTTIRRMVDMDHYEVVDCPVVKNRSDLQD